MDREKFDDFWRVSFEPKAQKILHKNPELKFHTKCADNLYVRYEDKKNRLHNYMVSPDGRIDRHKIASVLISSILELQPFSGTTPQKSYDLRFAKPYFMPNEVWAWHCGLSIVYSFILAIAQQNSDIHTYNLFSDKGFYFPPCSHGNYQEHVLRSLYHARIKNSFDIFSFSHVLFFVEEYTKLARVSAAL